MGQIEKGLQYLKSIPCILKIVEIVILLIAIGCVGYFLDKAGSSDYKKKGNLQFFMFVVVVGWLLAMALLAFFVIGLHEKIAAINWPLSVAIISALWAVLLLISSSLVADSVAYYDKSTSIYGIKTKSSCELWDELKTDVRCGQLIGGAVFGFIAMVLFAIDTFVHFRMFIIKATAQAPQAPQPPQPPQPPQAPQATAGAVSY